jgi:hypothetical protein
LIRYKERIERIKRRNKMAKRVSWIITDQNVVVNYDGETHIVKRSDVLADRLIKAVKENKLDEIPTLVSTAKRIASFSNGNFAVKNGRVEINGVVAPEVLGNKIIKFSNEGLPFKPLLKFAENLQSNPSFRAVNELFSFLEKNDHPITESGNFIAYKRVRGDFKDIHSGTMDNSVGKTLEIPRNQVDEDATRTCSYGLHVANWDYAHTQFASSDSQTDVMLEVEVNPRDVVAVPVDYSNSKMRVCKYVVLGIVTTPFEPSESLRRDVVDPCSNCDGCGDDGACCCENDACCCDEDTCDNCDEVDCVCEDCCDSCGEEECYGDCGDVYPYEDEIQS